MTEMPAIVDRDTWQRQIDELRVREKAHTREGDAIEAARRRLPMVEIDPATPLDGPAGRVHLVDAFEGRRQLLAYFHMWHTGRPAAEQCEGCSFFNGHVRELSYLHSRGVTYATLCEGPYDEASRYREFLGLEMPWYSVPEESYARLGVEYFGRISAYLRDGDRVFETYWTTGRGTEALANSYALLDLTVHGRQEAWEDSPRGWPQPFAVAGEQFRTGGRPSLQWSRLSAGRSDDLGVDLSAAGSGTHCH